MEVNIEYRGEQLGVHLYEARVISRLVPIDIDGGFGTNKTDALKQYGQNVKDRIATLQTVLLVVDQELGEKC